MIKDTNTVTKMGIPQKIIMMFYPNDTGIKMK